MCLGLCLRVRQHRAAKKAAHAASHRHRPDRVRLGPPDPSLLDVAVKAALKIVDLDPDDVTAYSTLSQIYVWKGDKDTAEHWGGKARVAGWKQQLKRDKAKGPPSI